MARPSFAEALLQNKKAALGTAAEEDPRAPMKEVMKAFHAAHASGDHDAMGSALEAFYDWCQLQKSREGSEG